MKTNKDYKSMIGMNILIDNIPCVIYEVGEKYIILDDTCDPISKRLFFVPIEEFESMSIVSLEKADGEILKELVLHPRQLSDSKSFKTALRWESTIYGRR